MRFNTLRSFIIAAILISGALALCAENIEVDQILTDYSINPVNADLHYYQRDLRLKGMVVGIANEDARSGIVGRAELVSETGKPWFCSFQSEQTVDIAKLRRGDHVVLAGVLQMHILRGSESRSNDGLRFEHCSLISQESAVHSIFDVRLPAAPLRNVNSKASNGKGIIDGPPVIDIPITDPLALRTNAATNGVPEVGGDDTVPVILHKVEPILPEEAQKAKVQGNVRLSATIDEQGIPIDIQVEKPAGFGMDEQAVLALRQCRFRPGFKNGAPVKTRVFWEVKFSCYDCSSDVDPAPLDYNFFKPQGIRNLKAAVSVFATFSISKEGNPNDIVVKQFVFCRSDYVPAKSDPRIADSVVNAISSWKFRPAWRDGVAVDSAPLSIYQRVMITFDLFGGVTISSITPVRSSGDLSGVPSSSRPARTPIFRGCNAGSSSLRCMAGLAY